MKKIKKEKCICTIDARRLSCPFPHRISAIKSWCAICEKNMPKHKSLNGILIHKRDDVPDGIFYLMNTKTMYAGKPKGW